MDNAISAKISKTFGKKTRIRVCGILVEDGKILLVKHNGLGDKGHLWSPPGGAPKFSEDLMSALKREFFEETGLLIHMEKFLCVFEYIKNPLHSVEIFFLVSRKGGKLIKGMEPEISDENIIVDLKFFSDNDIVKMDNSELHGLLSHHKSIEEIVGLNGYVSELK